MAERERGAASRLCSDVFTLSSERDSVATKVTSCIKHGVLVVDPTRHSLHTERRRAALPILPAEYRSLLVISRRAPRRDRGDAQWRAARCCSQCQDDSWSRAIQSSQNRNRDDPLAPMKRRLRSTAAPLP